MLIRFRIMNAKSALNLVSQDDINWARQNSIYIGLRDYNAREGHLKDLANKLSDFEKTKLTFAKKLLTLGFSLEEIARETDIPRDVIINL